MNAAARRTAIIVTTIAIAGALLYAVFVAAVVTKAERAPDDSPIHYFHAEDDDAALPNDHLLIVEAWSRQVADPVTVVAHVRVGDGAFERLEMTRVEDSRKYVLALPPLPEGDRYFYYVEITDRLGNQAHFPEGAPDAPLLHVRFEGYVNPFVLGLHITLMIGAVFFLLHSLHFSWLGLRRSGSLVGKAYKGVLWGWVAFFVGGIPLGIYVSGAALGWHNAWGGWPLGTDITDSKTELLIVYWGVLLALRADLLKPGWPRRISNRAFAWSVFAGAALTALVYAIPHSIFFQ